MITLRQLRYLRALADTGHFGQAASQVKVSQPALSVQIKALEDALGAPLVERKSRNFVLTPLGRNVSRMAEGVLAQVADIEQLARLTVEPRGQVILGVIPTVAAYLLPTVLPEIRRAGLTQIGVREASAQTLLSDLAAGRIDAAILSLPTKMPGLVEEPLFTDRFLLAGQAGSLGPRRTVDAVPVGKLLMLGASDCLATQVVAALGIDAGQVRSDLRAASLTTLCHLTAEGLGMTVLPEIAIAAEARATLEVQPFEGASPSRRIGLVRRKMLGDVAWFETLLKACRASAPVGSHQQQEPEWNGQNGRERAEQNYA